MEGSKKVVHAALDAGITFFDTSDMYGDDYGVASGSEICLGQTLGAERKKIILATKFGNERKVYDANTKGGSSRRVIMIAVEASLKRLHTDYIDLYQAHKPDPNTPIEETMRALDDLVKQGKVRHIGCSNYPAWRVVDAQWTATHNNLTPFISCQEEYSALARRVERDMIPAMQKHGIGMLPYLPLAAGLVAEKQAAMVAFGAAERLAQQTGPYMRAGRQRQEVVKQAERLRTLAEENKRLLERAIAVQARVIGTLVSGVKPVAQRYGAQGSLHRSALGAIALSSSA